MAVAASQEGDPLAFFLTWTMYGTWLPGDQRGSWHDGEFHPANTLFRQMAASDMKESMFGPSACDRAIIESTIRSHCDIRQWTLHAVSVRSNHVHVLLTAAGYDPKTTRDQLKAWCTRRLKPNHPGRSRFWTEGGSCRVINHENDLETVMTYVGEAQDRKNRDV